MANVVLVGLEPSAAIQIGQVLAGERHEIRTRTRSITPEELSDADIVFAGGEKTQYLSLFRHVRESLPSLPFVVVTRLAKATDWLDALDAGATDYCSAPFEPRQISWLLETALHQRPRTRSAAA